MSDQGKKEDSWVRRLPPVIIGLAVLIFIIAALINHNQYQSWKTKQSELTGKIEQTGSELDNLKQASGALQDVTNKVENQKQKLASLTATLEALNTEKKTTESTLFKLRQEVSALNQQLTGLAGQISANKKKVAELTNERETLQKAISLQDKDFKETSEMVKAAKSQQEMLIQSVKQLESDIVNKKNVLASIEFLQRQKPMLEKNAQDLKTRNDLAATLLQEQQSKLDALQDQITQSEVTLQEQGKRHSALNKELAELTESVKNMSSQQEALTLLSDHQTKLEYLDKLQQQKESMEIAISNLLQKAKELEAIDTKPQQNEPTP